MNQRQMSDPDSGPQLNSMDKSQKGAYFLAILKSKLLLSNFIVAVPEPDLGEDLWIALGAVERPIYAAQVKSSYPGPDKRLIRGSVKYTFNVKLHNLVKSFDVPFVYFFGLYDAFAPNNFHIACIPSIFFKENWNCVLRGVAKAKRGEQVNLYFYYLIEEKRYDLFTPPSIDVTQFFGNFNAVK